MLAYVSHALERLRAELQDLELQDPRLRDPDEQGILEREDPLEPRDLLLRNARPPHAHPQSAVAGRSQPGREIPGPFAAAGSGNPPYRFRSCRDPSLQDGSSADPSLLDAAGDAEDPDTRDTKARNPSARDPGLVAACEDPGLVAACEDGIPACCRVGSLLSSRALIPSRRSWAAEEARLVGPTFHDVLRRSPAHGTASRSPHTMANR